MKLSDKMTMEERGKSMDSMVRRKGWKLLEEQLIEKKTNLISQIVLRIGMRNGTAFEMNEKDIDRLRQQVLDINWFLNLPRSYIMSNPQEEPSEEIKEGDFDDVLNDVLT